MGAESFTERIRELLTSASLRLATSSLRATHYERAPRPRGTMPSTRSYSGSEAKEPRLAARESASSLASLATPNRLPVLSDAMVGRGLIDGAAGRIRESLARGTARDSYGASRAHESRRERRGPAAGETFFGSVKGTGSVALRLSVRAQGFSARRARKARPSSQGRSISPGLVFGAWNSLDQEGQDAERKRPSQAVSRHPSTGGHVSSPGSGSRGTPCRASLPGAGEPMGALVLPAGSSLAVHAANLS